MDPGTRISARPTLDRPTVVNPLPRAPRLLVMPGPRRTLAAVVCAAVVGLFLVAGMGSAQATSASRATSTHGSTSAHQGSQVATAPDHTHLQHPDLGAVPPSAWVPPRPATAGAPAAVAATPAPAERVPDAGRGPPAA